METLITCNEDPTFLREIESISFHYNAEERSFEFSAGGYIITSAKLFKILKVDSNNSSSNILLKGLLKLMTFVGG